MVKNISFEKISLKERLITTIFGGIPNIFFGKKIRNIVYRSLFSQIGDSVNIQHFVELIGTPSIEIGNQVSLLKGVQINALGHPNNKVYIKDRVRLERGVDIRSLYDTHIIIDENAYIGPYVVITGTGDIKIGKVRYSSSRRFQQTEADVPVYVKAPDFAGKRTALFGMTRTGKSNTLKKIIQACVEMSSNAEFQLDKNRENSDEILKPFKEDNNPKYPIGQIIFDINGEYANPNLQDQGTAIFDLYKEQTIRYSTIAKPDFLEMKVNFYNEIENGFDLIRTYPTIANDNTRFVTGFKTVDLVKPEDYATNRSAAARHDRRIAVYLCCLYRAGFQAPSNLRIKFTANQEVRNVVSQGVNPSQGISLDEAANWWESLWDIYENNDIEVFRNYKQQNDREWADDDLKALLVMLTRKSRSGKRADCSGFRVLKPVIDQHTSTAQEPFDRDILNNLRQGKIVIIDLSLGNPEIQRMFSERICNRIFTDAINRFTSTQANNFIQFYFEEAHNLFPKKEDKDLSQIYNRLAKEGAKLNLGLIYATQEVSSISSNILKATQNWFISHLNNEDEIKELRKYYDFSDFTEGLIRFSQDTDKGFVRMKTYSNPFVIPVQIGRFPPE